VVLPTCIEVIERPHLICSDELTCGPYGRQRRRFDAERAQYLGNIGARQLESDLDVLKLVRLADIAKCGNLGLPCLDPGLDGIGGA
jgi:hypothetical protein